MYIHEASLNDKQYDMTGKNVAMQYCRKLQGAETGQAFANGSECGAL